MTCFSDRKGFFSAGTDQNTLLAPTIPGVSVYSTDWYDLVEEMAAYKGVAATDVELSQVPTHTTRIQRAEHVHVTPTTRRGASATYHSFFVYG